MFRYLRLDVVQCEVHRLRLLALAFGTVTFRIPKRLGNGLFATELRNSPVIVARPMMGTTAFFSLLAFT